MKSGFFKIFATVCIAVCAFVLVACNGGDKSGDNEPDVKTITVTFETNGGTTIEPITVEKAGRLETILGGKTTSKDDKLFDGWYSDPSLDEQSEVSLDSYIQADVTLYAAWRDYTDAELLSAAAANTRINAVAAHDSGAVRFNTTTTGYSTVDVMLALDNGVITAGANEASNKYYKDGFLYYTSEGVGTKLQEKAENTAPEFLYLRVIGTVDFKAHKFYSVFAPMSMFRLADTSVCTLTRDGNTFTVTYKGSSAGVAHNWSEQGNPWVYFDAGKIFKFTVENNRVVKVEQIKTTAAYRTIEFYFDGDDVPEIKEPIDGDYTQKWQVINSNGSILLLTELNKAELDKKIYGDDFLQLTKNQTYYYDEAMTQAVPFVDGVAPINAHTKLYHEYISFDDLVIDSYTITDRSSGRLTLEGTSTDDDVKTTVFVRTDNMTTGSIELKINMSPYSATDKEFTVEIVDKQEGEKIEESKFIGGTSIYLPRSITRQYTVKLTAVKGGYTEYIVIKPMPDGE